MNTELPPPIAAFFKAHNTRETDDFNALFTSDALVTDEAHEYRGTAIKGWIDRATAEYKPTADVTDLAQVGDKTVVTAQVSGTFPGSPVQLRYNFTLKNDKIAALGLVKSLGAAEVVNYTKDDFSNAGRIYDVIHDTVGKSRFWSSMHAIKRGGVYVLPGPVWASPEGARGAIWANMTGSCKVIGGVAQGGIPALDFLAKLVETGEFRPVIDRRYPLASIAEAHRYAEAGHKKGMVITIAGIVSGRGHR